MKAGLTGADAKQRRALFFREMEKWLDRANDQTSMRNALCVLARARGVSVSDVCDHFRVSRQSASGIVKRERVDNGYHERELTWAERAANCLLVQGVETPWSSGSTVR